MNQVRVKVNGYRIMVVINIAVLIATYFTCKWMYGLTVPKIYFGQVGVYSYIGLGVLGILPGLYSVLRLLSLNKEEQQSLGKHVINVVIVMILWVISLGSIGILIVVIPPIRDYTNNPKAYLMTNEDMERYAPIYKQFFPTEIPKEATEVVYIYEGYSTLLVSEGKIEASWKLPINEYEKSKEEIAHIAYMEEVDKEKYNIYLLNCAYPNRLKLQFKYDDQNQRVMYSMFVGEE
nr:hypothetical protein [uncultured Cellulosilyticum sp.]